MLNREQAGGEGGDGGPATCYSNGGSQHGHKKMLQGRVST